MAPIIMDQTIFNWILSSFGALAGFLLHAIWQAVKDLQTADKELANKVSEMEVLVAGAYLLKTDFNAGLAAVVSKLDRIEDKLDRKADKHTS